MPIHFHRTFICPNHCSSLFFISLVHLIFSTIVLSLKHPLGSLRGGLCMQLSPDEKDLSKLLDVDFYASKKRTVTASIFEKLNSQVDGCPTSPFPCSSLSFTCAICYLPKVLCSSCGEEQLFPSVGDSS